MRTTKISEMNGGSMKQDIRILKKTYSWKNIKIPKGWRLAHDWELLKQFKENRESLKLTDKWWCNSEGLPGDVALVSRLNFFYYSSYFNAECRNVDYNYFRVRGVMIIKK